MTRFWATAIAPWRERTEGGSKGYVRLGRAWRALAVGNGLLFLAMLVHVGWETVDLLKAMHDSRGDIEFGPTFRFLGAIALLAYGLLLLGGATVFVLLAHLLGRGFHSWRQRKAASPSQTQVAAACAFVVGLGILVAVGPELFPFTEVALRSLGNLWVDVGIYAIVVGVYALVWSSRPSLRAEFSPSAPPPLPRL